MSILHYPTGLSWSILGSIYVYLWRENTIVLYLGLSQKPIHGGFKPPRHVNQRSPQRQMKQNKWQRTGSRTTSMELPTLSVMLSKARPHEAPGCWALRTKALVLSLWCINVSWHGSLEMQDSVCDQYAGVRLIS